MHLFSIKETRIHENKKEINNISMSALTQYTG